jgi:hypothetical protein
MRGLIGKVAFLFCVVSCLLLVACTNPQDKDTAKGETATRVEEAAEEGTFTPEVPQSTSMPSLDPFNSLLSYVPAIFADLHVPASFGSPLYLLDVARMRNDLGIGPVTGSSDYQEKLDLIIALGEAKQGLSIYPSYVFPKAANSFDAWGWDFADVDSILHLLGDGLTILTGDFSRSEVLQNLEDKGEDLPDLGLFSLYRIKDGNAIVAVKPDVLIVAANPYPSPQDEVGDLLESTVRFIIQTNLDSAGIDVHPVVNQLLTELPESWGILLAPSPDVIAWEAQPFEIPLPDTIIEELESQGKLGPSLAPLPWDLMAIGFTNSEKVTDLVFVYHYPGGELTEEEVDFARTALSEPGSFVTRNATLQQLVQLTDFQVKEPLLVVKGTTGHKDFLGNTVEKRDYPIQCGLSLCREAQ